MFERFKQQLTRNRHRGLVVISGQLSWCLQQLPALNQNTLWLGDEPQPNVTPVNPNQAQQWLGRECEQLIINGFDGIDLNALGALSGTVKAGGLCILLCPEFEHWLSSPDPQNKRFCVYGHDHEQRPSRWLQHLVQTIKADSSCLIHAQTQSTNEPQLAAIQPSVLEHSYFKTADQRTAVEKIQKVATGHRRRPLVLTADRGRGKSSSLGLAIVELFKQGKSKVIISAPQIASVQAVFDRVTEQLAILKKSATTLVTPQGEVQFVPPDELIRNKYQTDLLMIDEAAAIAAPMLTSILKAYSRVVFTSTIHGYEGTGRGFEVRFKKRLNQLTPNWQSYVMEQPVRFAKDDPLESFVNQALMMKAKAADIPDTLPLKDAAFKHWDRDKLIKDIHTLEQIMGLLMLSHYKTAPNDLRHLLDGSNIQIYTLSVDGIIVATTLLAVEGDLPEGLCQAIWQGKQRPRGHLLAQTLGFHSGFVEAPRYRFGRIIRIAVHPSLQNHGLGSQMLKHLNQSCKAHSFDFLGSTFGATAQLLRFWHNNGFDTVRMGMTVEATSNEYSAVVLKPLSNKACDFLTQIRSKFQQELAFLLGEFYPKLSSQVIAELLEQSGCHNLSENDCQIVKSYIAYNREYEFCSPAIYQYVLCALEDRKTSPLTEQELDLLVNKVLRKRSWAEVCIELGYHGKKQAQSALKAVIAKL